MIQSQYQSYEYDTFHYCPSTSSVYTTVPVLLIWYNTLLPQYQPIQYITTSVTVPLMYTTVLLPVLLIQHRSLLSQYQFYWYDTVHWCPSTCPNDTTVTFCRGTSATDMIQSTTAQYKFSWYDIPLLSQYESWWYDTVHKCPSPLLPYTSPFDTLLIPVLVIFNSPLLPQF